MSAIRHRRRFYGDRRSANALVCWALPNSFWWLRPPVGAIDAPSAHGVKDRTSPSSAAPGAFEIPLVVKKVAEMKQFDAIVNAGGSDSWRTPHFEYVAVSGVKGIASLSWNTASRCFGVLTRPTASSRPSERSRQPRRQQGRRSRPCPPFEMVTCFKQLGRVERVLIPSHHTGRPKASARASAQSGACKPVWLANVAISAV